MSPPPSHRLSVTSRLWEDGFSERIADTRRESELRDADLGRKLDLHVQYANAQFASLSAQITTLGHRMLLAFTLTGAVSIGIKTKFGQTILSLLGLM